MNLDSETRIDCLDGPSGLAKSEPQKISRRMPAIRHRAVLQALPRLGWTALPAFLMRAGTLIISVVSVRLIAPFLGKDDLGTYAALQAIAAWTALAALGLPEACSGICAKFHLVGKYRSAERYIRSSYRIIFRAASGLSLLGGIVFVGLSWLGRIDPMSALPVLVAATLSLMAMPFGLAQASLNAEGEIGRSTAWNLGNATLGLLAIWVVTSSWMFLEHRLLAVCTALGSANLLARGAMYLLETRRCYGPLVVSQRSSGRSTGALLKSSYPFVVLSLAALAAFQVDRIVSYHFLSAKDTAELDVTLKIFLAAYGIYAVVVAKLWNSVGYAWNAGDRHAARRVLAKSLVAAALFWTALGALIIVLMSPIVDFATHGTIKSIDLKLAGAVLAYIATRALVDSVTISIFAIRKQHETMGTAIAHGVLNIPFSVAGCLMFGLVGIVYGQLAALLLTSGWRFPLIFWRATTVSR